MFVESNCMSLYACVVGRCVCVSDDLFLSIGLNVPNKSITKVMLLDVHSRLSCSRVPSSSVFHTVLPLCGHCLVWQRPGRGRCNGHVIFTPSSVASAKRNVQKHQRFKPLYLYFSIDFLGVKHFPPDDAHITPSLTNSQMLVKSASQKHRVVRLCFGSGFDLRNFLWWTSRRCMWLHEFWDKLAVIEYLSVALRKLKLKTPCALTNCSLPVLKLS